MLPKPLEIIDNLSPTELAWISLSKKPALGSTPLGRFLVSIWKISSNIVLLAALSLSI